MDLIRRFLHSRITWFVMGAACFYSVGRMAVRQLAKDPRFVARPNEVSIPWR